MNNDLESIRAIINAYNTTLRNLAQLCQMAAYSEARTIPIELIVNELQLAYNNINKVYDVELERLLDRSY